MHSGSIYSEINLSKILDKVSGPESLMLRAEHKAINWSSASVTKKNNNK